MSSSDRNENDTNKNDSSSSSTKEIMPVATEVAQTNVSAQRIVQDEKQRIATNLATYRQHIYSNAMEIDQSTSTGYDDHDTKKNSSSFSFVISNPVNRIIGNNSIQRVESALSNDNDDRSLSCCMGFIYESVWPGLGLLGESYMLFSVGILRPIWNIVFPSCFLSYTTCSTSLIESISYSVILGVILGMISIGYAANNIGRRTGSIITASFMCAGAWLLTILSYLASYYKNYPIAINTIFRLFCGSLFIFGIGVGGEYPLSASSASEKAMEQLMRRRLQEKDQLAGTVTGEYHHENPSHNNNNGQRVQLVFTMQGMGIFLNSIIMTLLIGLLAKPINAAYYVGNEYKVSTLLQIWQITYTIGACILSTVLYTRYVYLKESKVWADDQNKKQHEQDEIQHAIQPELLSSKQQYGQQEILVQVPGCSQYSNKLISSIRQQKQRQQEQDILYIPPDPPGIIKRSSLDQRNDGISDENEEPTNLSLPSSLENDNGEKNPPTSNNTNSGKTTSQDPDKNIVDGQMIKSEQPQTLSSSSSLRQNLHTSPNRNPTSMPAGSSIQLLFQHYGMRLIGVSLSWMLWDVAFYGNKLFQSTFLLALTGSDTSLMTFAVAATINSGVALLGYFCAAAIIDSPRIGRCKLQQWGFLLTGVLFVSVGFFFDRFDPNVLVLMYLGSSFFGQLGPNATTFLIPAEIFPTEMRTISHGIAAASGKFGALIASVMFNYIKYQPNMFLFSGYASFAAFIVTYVTIPETIGLDLYENDRKWRLAVSGKEKEYVGDASNPRFLSWYERNIDSIQYNIRQNLHHKHENLENDDGFSVANNTPYKRVVDPPTMV